ncbi:zinc transporter ZntB [Azorhizobium doebereinerae]|uniref:zinc transporter ZntB n=1 Tax=Azorhizobium doebereinerae TaxID=281091 RepID=UPI00054F23F2|nr:zinc transporter ZntB [Azorhizobium doebereinerae]
MKPLSSDGLLDAWLFDGKGGARRLPADEARTHRAEEGGFVWLHFRRLPNLTDTWLHTSSGIDPHIVEQLMDTHSRPRCQVLDEGALLILRAVNLQPNSLPEEMTSLTLWVDAERIISVQYQPISALADYIDAMGRRRMARTQGEMVADLATRLVERLDLVVAMLIDEADDLEDDAQRMPAGDVLPRVLVLRRVAMKLRRHIAPQREALNHFSMEDDPWIGPKDRNRLRDAADRVSRFSEELDTVRERSILIREQIVDRRAEQMNQSMLVLAAVTVVFAPLTLISGMLGMNVGGIPGNTDPAAFWVISVLFVLLGTGLVRLFKHLKWF